MVQSCISDSSSFKDKQTNLYTPAEWPGKSRIGLIKGDFAVGFVWCLLSPHPAASHIEGLVIADSGCVSTSPYN